MLFSPDAHIKSISILFFLFALLCASLTHCIWTFLVTLCVISCHDTHFLTSRATMFCRYFCTFSLYLTLPLNHTHTHTVCASPLFECIIPCVCVSVRDADVPSPACMRSSQLFHVCVCLCACVCVAYAAPSAHVTRAAPACWAPATARHRSHPRPPPPPAPPRPPSPPAPSPSTHARGPPAST